jgi:hypothetical protein
MVSERSTVGSREVIVFLLRLRHNKDREKSSGQATQFKTVLEFLNNLWGLGTE